MMYQRCFLLAVLFSAVLAGTSKAEDTDYTAAVKQIFRTRCLECHGDTRREGDVHILEPDSYVGEDGHVVPNSVDESYLYELISTDDEDMRMPEAPRAQLTTAEIETVRKWIEAGAKAFPADVQQPESPGEDPALSNVIGEEYVLTSILDYLNNARRDDRRYLRFFSANHLLNSGATAEEIEINRQALAKAINHLSWQHEIVEPKVVDKETGTIFAIDIRDLGWDESPLEMVGDVNGKELNVDIFDLILLEYPYGLVYETSDVFDDLFQVFLGPADLVRPVPYIRVDWFVSVATQPPLYEDIMQLPHQLAELETMLGINSERNIESQTAKRAGMTLSGVSRNNRVVERHPSRYGAYWKSYDFETSKGQQNMFADPINFHFAGGEMIWNLPNGLQGYLVTDTVGNRLLAAPTAIVTDKFAEDKVVRNGLACMRCHDKGMKRFSDNIRPAFESLRDSPGLNRRDILRLYPDKEEMDKLLDRDEKKFLDALTMALGKPQDQEPLIPTARKFMDAPVTISQAAAELGLKDPSSLGVVFKLPQFTRLGLAGLASGGVIRRDTWEDYFDRVAQHLGIGIALPPIDGVTRPDQLAVGFASQLTLATNKRSNVFSPGEKMTLSVTNNTGKDLFIELVGTSALGRKVRLFEGVKLLRSGQTYHHPEVIVQPKLGSELVTVFASVHEYSAGTLLRGKNVADRFVHDFWNYDTRESRFNNIPAQFIKKTMKIETK